MQIKFRRVILNLGALDTLKSPSFIPIILSTMICSCSTVGVDGSSTSFDFSKYSDKELEFQYFKTVDYLSNFFRNRDYAYHHAISQEIDKRPYFDSDELVRMQKIAQLTRKLDQHYRSSFFGRSFNTEKYWSSDYPKPDRITKTRLSCEGFLSYQLNADVYEFKYDWPSIREFPHIDLQTVERISPYYSLKVYFRAGAYKLGEFIGYQEKFYIDPNNRTNYVGGDSATCNLRSR